MNEQTNVNVGYVSPLKRICMTIGELPSSYLETMTYYEMLVWFTKYLKETLIPTINNNAEAVSELQTLYEELRVYVNNYFDNLDVQDEIDNKLDAMAESGQLTDIIAQYLGLAGMITFNTVAEMKLAENLVNGSKCCTLGYHSVNDGGNAIYKVRTVTNDDTVDERKIIALYDNTLIAELIIENGIYIEQIGAYGDGIHDDTLTVQYAVDNFNLVKLNQKGKYLISDTISINKGLHNYVNIIGDGGGINGLPNIDSDTVYRGSSFIADTDMNKPMFELTTTRNCRFENFTIDGGAVWNNFEITTAGNATTAMKLTNSPYNVFNNVLFRGCTGNGFEVYGSCFTNDFINCSFSGNGGYGYDSHQCTEHVTTWFHNCRFDGNITGNAFITGRFLSFENCAFENSSGHGIEIGYGAIETSNLAFYSCDVEGNYGYGIKFNTFINGLKYISGQIIGKIDCNEDLFYIQNALLYTIIDCHLSTVNTSKAIYTPYATYLHGYFPKEFMECIQVASCPTFWSGFNEKPRDNYYTNVLNQNRFIGNVSKTYNVNGLTLNKYNVGEIKTLNHAFSSLTATVTNPVSPTDLNHTIYVKYSRGYNGSSTTTEVFISATPDEHGALTFNSSNGLWGQIESLYLYITDDVTLNIGDITVLER